MVRALVVGGNGFLGSHLVDALARAGHEVTSFDRYSAGIARHAEDVRRVEGEFLNRADLELAVRGQDLVFHFLSTTTPATAESDPSLDVRTNVAQSVELLQSCVAADVDHVYFASTGGAIYGDQDKPEYRETDQPLPVSPYGIGKLTIEHYLRFFETVHGLRSTALRISNPFGTRQHVHRKQGLIPIALREVALGNPVIRLGDGRMVRDYIEVGDLMRMIVRMLGQEHRHPVYNLGSGRGLTVNEVLAALERVVGRAVDVREMPVPASFVGRSVLDISRYREEFGDVELRSLESGVAMVWDEVRQQVGAE